jgi:CBS domain-containing protein
MLVKNVMTRTVEQARISDTIFDATRKMSALNVGVLPVFDGSRPAGILTDRDITVRAVAEGIDTATEPVARIMTTDLLSIGDEAPIEEAADLMVRRQVRRLLVRTKDDEVCGIISLGDIATKERRNISGRILQDVSQPSEPVR